MSNEYSNDQLLQEKFGHFSWLQKIENYFSYNTFVSYFCWQGGFFKRIYRDGIKNIFSYYLKGFSNEKYKT